MFDSLPLCASGIVSKHLFLPPSHQDAKTQKKKVKKY